MYPGCMTAAGEPATVGGTLEREANSMAFKNEKISEQDLFHTKRHRPGRGLGRFV
jgi:hypothetical protein